MVDPSSFTSGLALTMERMTSSSSTLGTIWKPWVKVLASVAILLQLLAVLAEPLRFFSYGTVRGSSPAADPVRNVLGPYVEFAFLNHGYFFFAPEPGPSHLMQCELRFADGKTIQIRYPDKTAQRPRLLYHRHFMLAEFLNQLHAPPVDPELVKEASPQEIQVWTENRKRFEMVRNSMQRHLVSRFSAESAIIERMRHILPGSDLVLKDRVPLNDPSLFMILPDGVISPNPDASLSYPGPPLRSLPAAKEELVEPSP